MLLILGILGPPYCGIGATIRIGREMLCLPYAGFFKEEKKRKMNSEVRENLIVNVCKGNYKFIMECSSGKSDYQRKLFETFNC